MEGTHFLNAFAYLIFILSFLFLASVGSSARFSVDVDASRVGGVSLSSTIIEGNPVPASDAELELLLLFLNCTCCDC